MRRGCEGARLDAVLGGEDVESPETAPEQATPAPRWFERALPMTVLAVVLIGVAALLVPAFRDQVELSTSRQSQPYVELYFQRTPGRTAQAVCAAQGAAAQVRFVVASHLDDRQGVAYRIAVTPHGKGKVQRRAGTVRVTPGTAVEVRKAFARPRGGYTVSVRLPALGEQLRAHCAGRRS
jgi:negative regulator of sigma E activity